MTTWLMNSAVMPTPGVYRYRLLDRARWATEVAAALDEGARSLIGYPETANLLSRLVGRRIPVCRDNAHLEPGDVIYVARLKARAPGEKGRWRGYGLDDFEFGVVEYHAAPNPSGRAARSRRAARKPDAEHAAAWPQHQPKRQRSLT